MFCFTRKYVTFVLVLLLSLCAGLASNNISSSTTNTHVSQTNLASILEHNSIIFALTSFSKEPFVGTTCRIQLQELRQSILEREPWALKVLDASGHRPPGFMFGNNFWLGSRDGCEAAQTVLELGENKYIKRKMYPEILTATSPFPVDYRILQMMSNSPWQVSIKMGQLYSSTTVGLCTPTACTLSELTQLMTVYLESDLFRQSDLFESKPVVMYAKDLHMTSELFTRPLFLLVSVSFIITIILTWTAFRARLQSRKDASAVKSLEQFNHCFDVQSNWQKLFVLPGSTTSTFSMLNGTRFICAMVAIYFHQYALVESLTRNSTELFVLLNTIGSMDVAVDVFFSISGFLQAYNFMRDAKKIQQIRQNSFLANIKELLTNVFHRILRLGPLYLIVLAVSDLWFGYQSDVSVFKFPTQLHDMCVNNGWYNLVFLQNFVLFNNACQIWTWSLACDVQYFTLIATLLIVNAKYPKIAKAAVWAVILSSIVYSYCAGVALNYQLSLDSTFEFFNELYAHPMARVMPYILGAVTGWFYVEWNSKIVFPKAMAELGSHLAIIGLIFFLKSAPLGRGYSARIDTILLILQRLGFSLSACCGILCLANGRVAWLTRLLNWKVFQKGYQVSFAMSVINQPLIIILYNFNTQPLHFEIVTMTVMSFGIAVVLYFISGFFTLFFEMPYRNWLSMLHKRQREKMT